MVATFTSTPVTLTSGHVVRVPDTLLTDFRGTTEDSTSNSYLVIATEMKHDDGSEYLMSLTDCCFATATADDEGIICRSCYEWCDDIHAGFIKPENVIFRV